jgi:hypothetical protein
MQIEVDVAAVGDVDAVGSIDASILELLDLGEEARDVDYAAGADEVGAAVCEDAGG